MRLLKLGKKIFLLSFVLAQPALAQLANYNSIILGDRSAGMGGAATALLDDTSSAAYFNPAVLAQSTGSAFSAAVGIYKKFDTQYGSENDYTKTPLKVSTGFFRSLPASTGNVIRKNGWTLGLSILVPEYESFKGDLKSSAENTSTLSYTDETLWVGGTLSKPIDETSSWGLTLYYTARNFVRSVQDRSYPSGTEAILFNSEETVSENAIVPILGYLKKDVSWTWGASLRVRGIPFSSDATYFESITRTDPYSTTEINRNDLKSNAVVPTKLSLGLTKTIETWLLAATVDFYEGLSYEVIDLANYGTSVERKPITNLSLGLEKSFFDWFKIRLGAFTNFSPYPDPDPKLARYQGEHVDQGGFSANAVFVADDKIAYTFGGYYTGGRGRALERINQNFEVVTKSQQIFTMLVGTHFYF